MGGHLPCPFIRGNEGMKTQHVLIWLLPLVAFVAGCPAFGHGIDEESTKSSVLEGVAGKLNGSRSVVPPEGVPNEARRSKVTVYYFHRKVRCEGCLAVEKLSKRRIERGFPEPLRAGRLEFRPVLLDDKENWHYVDDYLLTGPSLVIIETLGERTVRWRTMDKVWDLLGSEDDFFSYVSLGIEEFLR